MKSLNSLTTRNPVLLLALAALGMAVFIGTAKAQPNSFSDNFNGASLDPAWILTGPPANHFGQAGGLYLMKDNNDGNQTTLQRNIGGTAGSWNAAVDYVGSPLRTPNTQTDVNWRFFGPNGFVEVAFNSFGDLRVFHGNSVASAFGDLVGNSNIGYTDGQMLNLRASFDAGLQQLSIQYGINGGPLTSKYLGGGNGGSFGNFYTDFNDVRMFKWGASVDEPFLGVDNMSLTAVPEPGSMALMGLGGFGLFLMRRRR